MIETPGTVAFFDFDGTLTTGDSLMPFLKQLEGVPWYYLKLAAVSPAILGYLAGVMRNDVAKTHVLKKFVKGVKRDKLIAAGRQFSQSVLPGMLRPEGMERLRWHQGQGHHCILVSASLDIYLNCWAADHGLHDVLSTRLVYMQGAATGEIEGSNCFGQEKALRIRQWLADRSPAVTYAYGDTKGDLPMLRQASQGYLWDGQRFVMVKK